MQSPCLVAALAYVARGWSAIPLCPPNHKGVPDEHDASCTSPGKAPPWPWKTYQERLPKEPELKLFWKRVPDCNVGIVMGPVSNLIGLDVDGQAGFDLLMQISDGNIPETLEFKTGSGRRLLFKWPGFEVNIKSIKVGGKEAIRILAKGSQTVAPPSIHENGNQYSWSTGHDPESIEPAECPEWLKSHLLMQAGDGPAVSTSHQPAAVPQGQAIDARVQAYLAKCPPSISGSGGHERTLKVATGLVRGFALAPSIALAWLKVYNQSCQPPWSEKELEHKIGEAENYTKLELGYLLKDAGQPIQPATKASTEPIQSTEPSALTRRFKGIEKKAIEWLWPKWIPQSKLAILDGDPGLGKSTMLLDLAARISTNGIMPDNSFGATGNVIIMSAEDGAEDTILPRLEAAGANLDRIHELAFVRKGGEDRPAEIPGDLPLIEKQIELLGARLLVIDPLMAFLYGADANKDQEIRRVLFKLSRIAEKHRCAIVCMRHLNKGGGGKAIYRGNSSIGVIGHARTGLLVALDPDDDQKRVLAVSKCNLAAKPKSLSFVLDPVEEVCRIGWCGQTHHKADDLVAQPPTAEEQQDKKDSKNKVAQTRVILEMLMEQYKGKLEIKMAKQECLAAGMGPKALDKAIKELQWETQYETDDLGKRTYYWTAPTGPKGPQIWQEEA